MSNLGLKFLIISAMVFYGIGLVLFGMLPFLRGKGDKRVRVINGVALSMASLGWIFTAVVFIFNWIIAQSPPFGNMYHVFVVTSLSLLPAFLLLRFYYRVGGGVFFFILAALLPLVPALIKVGSIDGWRPPPALQSIYFIPHVFIYMLAYLLMGIAALNSAARLIIWAINRKMEVRQRKIEGVGCSNISMQLKERVKQLETGNFILSENSIYRVVCCGFFFLCSGLIIGAAWAETAWGRYWGWDIKETWALINCVIYLIYFHLRYLKIDRKWLDLFLIVAVGTILVTLVGVNYMDDSLTQSLHSYTKES